MKFVRSVCILSAYGAEYKRSGQISFSQDEYWHARSFIQCFAYVYGDADVFYKQGIRQQSPLRNWSKNARRVTRYSI